MIGVIVVLLQPGPPRGACVSADGPTSGFVDKTSNCPISIDSFEKISDRTMQDGRMTDDATTTIRGLFTDHFGRVRALVQGLTSGLDEGTGTFRADPDANTIDWLVWHLSRVQDSHIAGIAATEQVWTSQGWNEHFGLPFAPDAHGFGQSSEEVAQVRVRADLLDGYHAAVHQVTLDYIDSVTPDELNRVVDAGWDPPVTVGARLVSVLGDCLQHAGQAAYVRGLAERAAGR